MLRSRMSWFKSCSARSKTRLLSCPSQEKEDDVWEELEEENKHPTPGCSVGEEEGEIQKLPEEEKRDLEIGCPSQEKEDDVREELEEENKHPTPGCSVSEEEGEIQKHPEEEKIDLEIGCPSQEKEDDVREELEEENKHPTPGCSVGEEEGEIQKLPEEEKRDLEIGCSVSEEEGEIQKHPEEEKMDLEIEKRKAVMDILCKLNLEKHKSKALSLQEVLKIGSGSLKEFTPQTWEDLPWHFLRKILALNVTARSTSFKQVVSDDQVLRRNEGNERIDKDIFVTLEMVFRNQDTNWEWHPYKEYRTYYPDWRIQPDPSIKASDYWKYIFKMFNDDFARQYNAKPADLPEDWGNITKEQALKALEDRYKL
ncbi:CARD domain-containing protein [Podarcis lilfordi]|uniref:CARD domain-containing protein n=1 Tax=Podarcis lilfordi TaxID=74358 RepID=A0AA35L749_9SAUR|nr:CARD domain-containing protein [Podarcis lilfordi]